MFNLLPSPQEIREKLFLSDREKQFIHSSRQKAQHIVEGTDESLAIIVGPCSIHDPDLALEYARSLKCLAEKFSLFLVMRTFFEKPRTTIGWKGFLYDPYLNGTDDIATGLYGTRELLIKLAKMKVPVATEFVDPLIAPYIEDLITWGFIGARTSSSQPHRQLASSFSFPVGIKNALDGDVTPAIQGVLAARASHVFAGIDGDGKICRKKSYGNPHSHVVLRGSNKEPNYKQAITLNGITSRLMIDCSHGNCQKNYEKQKEVFLSSLELTYKNNASIMGLMLESHLFEGSQALNDDLRYGVSITDPCIGWSMTEELLTVADEISSGAISSKVMRFTQS